MADVAVLDIRLHGRTIGSLTRVQGDRTLFSFDQTYIDDEDRPTLSLSFKESFGGLITEFRPIQTALPPFFSNLLPEGPMRDYLARRAGVHSRREFFLLWMLGRDLPGALAAHPAADEPWPPGLDEENETAREQFRRNALRFSLAGVQLKFSAVRNEGKNGGLTIPAQGVGGAWIVKLPSTRFAGVPENEYAMMTLASRLGIDVPEVQLVDPASIEGLPPDIGALKGQALAVRRFDRGPDGPIHIEDFAQVFGIRPEDKYEKASYRAIAGVLGIESDEADIAEFIRRLVFNTLIGNADMHLKNWSLHYPDRRHPRLAPAYDLLSTIVYLPDDKAALKYARTRRMDEFSLDELAYLAAKARLPEKPLRDTALTFVERFRALWQSEKRHLPLGKDQIDRIDRHIATIPLAAGR